MEDEKRIWFSTNYSIDNGLTVWRFSGREVYVFGGSLVVGFVGAHGLITDCGWPVLSSGMVGLLAPIATATILIRLVVDKPDRYFADWLEACVIKVLRAPLVNPPKTKEKSL